MGLSTFDLPGKRRRRDSNPRDAFAPNGFQDRRLQPLGHSSRSYCRHRPRTADRHSRAYERVAVSAATATAAIARPTTAWTRSDPVTNRRLADSAPGRCVTESNRTTPAIPEAGKERIENSCQAPSARDREPGSARWCRETEIRYSPSKIPARRGSPTARRDSLFAIRHS